MSLKAVFISDTHNRLSDIIHRIPDGDILVHSGDATVVGNSIKIAVFGNHMRKLPHKHKIFVPGNHDVLFETDESQARSLLGPGIHCLINEGVEIEGIKFWGSPYTPYFCNWAFNLFDDDLKKMWKKIPEDTDVLITHGPPHLVLDECPDGNGTKNVGCKHLLKEIQTRVNPTVHAFGHIHEGYGTNCINETIFINSSIMNGKYKMTNRPIIYHI